MSARKLKVLCCCCRAHLYWFTGEFTHGKKPNPNDFKPATSGIPQPQPGEAMMCLKCGSAWYMTNHRGSIYILTDQGIKPREPGGVPRVFTPDPQGYLIPELNFDFRAGKGTEYKEP
jgi:hypothetical protein